MIFTTKDGTSYAVDLKGRELASWKPDVPPLKFHDLSGVYVGSTHVIFCDEHKNHLLHITEEVVSVEGSPLDAVTAEEGNVLVLTKNSVYEIDQEQKLIRKLAGLNPGHSHVPQGDWAPYTQIEGFQVGRMGLIYYPERPQSQPFVTTNIREIRGTLVENPDPGLLSVSVALVKSHLSPE